MALHSKVHTNAAISSSGSSAIFRVPSNARRLVLSVVNKTAPTGTTPTITYELDTSTDGINFTRKGGALSSINSVVAQRTLYGVGQTQGQVVEPYAKVVWTVTGTTPNYPSITTVLTALPF